MGCHRDQSLCHHHRLLCFERPRLETDHPQGPKDGSHLNRHRSVLPFIGIRADNNRHPDKCQYLFEKLDVLHPLELPDCGECHVESNHQQETEQLGGPATQDSRGENDQEDQEQDRDNQPAQKLLFQL